MALDQYGILTKYLGWNSLGTVLGRGLTDEARTLGASIKYTSHQVRPQLTYVETLLLA